MRILIVEDERPTAEDIKELVKDILQDESVSIHIENTLDNALYYLQEKPVDLMFLDLNLNAKDGFEILKTVTSKSFHTVVISANINRAIEAFEYGVLDFIPKPYTSKRLREALERFKSNHSADGHSIKYLTVKTGYELKVIPLEEVKYFKSSNIYVELHLPDGKMMLYDKPIKQLCLLLPLKYFRIHKSYLINIEKIDSIRNAGGGQFEVILKSGDVLPVSREKITELKELIQKMN